MKVFFSRMSKNNPLLIFNFSVLVVAMIFARLVFADTLGWGDAMNSMSRTVTPWEYIVEWYENQNGRLSQALLGSFVNSLLREYFSTPESFPWWLFRGIWLFAAISAPVNIVAILSKSFQFKEMQRTLFIVLLVWLLWSTSPIYYYTNAWFSSAEFLSYTGPVIFTSFFMLFWMRLQSIQSTWIHWLVFSFSYIFLSLLNEHVMASLPVITVGIAVAGLIRREKKSSYIVQIIFVSFILSLIAISIHLTTPGQILRNSAINAHVPDFSIQNIFNWYSGTVPYVYEYLLPQYIYKGSSVFKIIVVVVHTSLLGLLFFTAKRSYEKIKDKNVSLDLQEELSKDFTLSVLSMMFLLAYVAALGTQLVSRYWPGYSGIFPSLLVTFGLVLSGVLYVEILLRKIKGRYKSLDAGKIKVVLAVVLMIGVALVIVKNNIHEIKRTNLLVKENTRIRLAYYNKISEYHIKNKEVNFILKGCPYAVSYFGWSVEPEWGISAYFRWLGFDDVFVVIDSNPDYKTRPLDKEYRSIDCSKL